MERPKRITLNAKLVKLKQKSSNIQGKIEEIERLIRERNSGQFNQSMKPVKPVKPKKTVRAKVNNATLQARKQ